MRMRGFPWKSSAFRMREPAQLFERRIYDTAMDAAGM